MEWNLKLIYESDQVWEEEFKKLDDNIKEIEKIKGSLKKLEGFRKYIQLDEQTSRRINRLFVYASMKHDLNQKDEKNSENFSRIYAKYNELISKTSWVEPELLSVGEEQILEFCKQEDLKASRFSMEKLFRLNRHIQSEEIEKVMSQYNDALDGYSKLYDNLTVVDNMSQEVVLENGDKLDINAANYQYYLGILENPKDRKKVFEAVFSFYDAHRATLAGIYNGIMQSEFAVSKNRGYETILDSKLYPKNISKDVIYSLVRTARENTEPLKKYLALRKKYFKLEQYHTYDRFLTFAKSEVEYSYDQSKKMVLEACKAMGEDFYKKACKVLEDGRVSVEIQDGKTTGAYSTSCYENGPFILLNHNQKLDDAFTIAHEAGHSIHTLYSIEGQPYQTHDYEIFVAEIASTFNEQLFLDYLLKNTKSKNEKIVLLQQAIDGLIATFYRQTLFADYELQAHQMVEEGKIISADVLSEIMTSLYQTYYGIDLNQEPYKAMVWGYIPHLFGSPFYVYQYATSFAASMAIYEKVKHNVSGAKEAYITLLKSGGSDYPVELVKRAGVDLTKQDSFLAVVHRLDSLVDELSKLLGK